MLDYSKITEEEIEKRTVMMPATLRAIYESDNFGFELLKLANDKFFDEDEANTLQMLVGLYLMGFMTAQELSEEISTELYLEPVESDEMVSKIKSLIATATLPIQLKQSLGAESPALGQARARPGRILDSSASPSSEGRIGTTSLTKGPAPFMIHTHEEPKAVSETKTFIQPQGDFSRPVFKGSERASFIETPKVTVDFGAPEKPKIVNYVVGQVATPIKTQPKSSAPPSVPVSSVVISPDIHPENIIDLKDLPK